MPNSDLAFPEVEIPCRDRLRKFCLNLWAFRVLEELMQEESKNPDYDVLTSFEWEKINVRKLTKIYWAAMHYDSRKDKEPWTLDKAADVLDLLGIVKAKNCMQESLRRALPKEQIRKSLDVQEKKILKKKKNKNQ